MATGYRNPPKFDEEAYESWKNELSIWELVTDLDKKKQALAVTLSLSGKAREAALAISAPELNKDDGMNTLIQALDNVFQKERVDSAYEAYKTFDGYRKSDSTSMGDFIIEFDQRYQRTRKFEMALPDAVLAFKLLDSANLTTQQRQLALTACQELKYDSMKSALKRIFGDGATVQSGASGGAIAIKQETAFLTDQGPRRFKPSGFKRPGFGTRRYGNPTNRFGGPSRSQGCRICQSIFHWQRDCPHKDKTESVNVSEETDVEQCNLTLFTQDKIKMTANEVFVAEVKNAAVIDTACTRTVCGEKWLQDYMDTVGDNVKVLYSHKPFKFGDGNIVYSSKRVQLPATVGTTKCDIDTEVVSADIPLLLSKASLKRAGAILDIQNDKAVMFSEPVELQFTASGHYCIDLTGSATDKPSAESNEVLMTDTWTEKDKVKELTKLHKQFGHASCNRMKELLKNAGVDNKNTFLLLEQVTNSCDICQRHKRANPKPIVGLPQASDYNQTVAVDLHQLEANVWYLHIIDEFTRFSAGCITRTKQTSQFVKNFIKHWISIHGAPQRLFSDNGGEFDSHEVRDMAENFNIQVITTPAYSPWSNGLLERHNQTLTEILLKVKKDQHLDWDTALAWALMSKNMLQNVHGYSPYQLVFGRNPNLPSIFTDLPPALEGNTRSQTVADHITALHAARQEFLKAESCERIRRALLRQTRPSAGPYVSGDRVFYKRPDGQEWRGPGKVIGSDGAVVFVRHGGMLVRVHGCRLRKVEEPLCGVNQDVKPKDEQQCITSKGGYQPSYDETDTGGNASQDDTKGHQASQTSDEILKSVKVGQSICYTHLDTKQPVKANVLSRAGKSTGANKNWYNLKLVEPSDMKDDELSVDLSQVKDLRIGVSVCDGLETRTVDDDSVLIVDDLDMTGAKTKELESWKHHDVFEEVPYQGQRLISTRWVCSMKTTQNGIIPKARLVARGFEEFGDYVEKDSPTCGHDSLRVVLSILATKGWKLHSMDIKTAFLQGDTMDRDVYVKPPKEANVQGVWHLKKCVYGLKDASLQWYRRVKTVLLETGGIMSKVDSAVFYWKDDSGNVIGILACHVDDFIWGGTDIFESTIISQVRSAFNVGKEDSVAFQYCGIDLQSVNDNILLNQDKYTDSLTKIDIHPSRAEEKDDGLTGDEKHSLRSKIGQLLWLAHQSRPDLLFDVTLIASKLKDAKVKDIMTMNKIIVKAKSSKMHLTFQRLGSDSDISLVVFSDAALGNLPDGGSQGGYLILLVGESGKFSPIWWNSRKIRRVVRSTLSAETLSMSDAIDMAVFIATLYSELTKGQPDPTNLNVLCITDCKSLVDAVKSSKCVLEKRLRIEMSAIKELIENGQIKDVQWCDTTKQLADSLTKSGASSLLLRKTLQMGELLI